ncbi:MAG: response regulator transcription factor [Acidobacteriales bacterium]|nr:response regulator transcription factor [Terriglobales bacterium]
MIEGLRGILNGCPDLNLVGVAASATEALPLVAANRPRVVLVDQTGGLRGALQFVTELRGVAPESQVVLWANALGEVDSMRALKAGVRGIVKRAIPVETLLECLRAVAGGSLWIENTVSNQAAGLPDRKTGPRLTTREQEIVQLVCRGYKNRQIAQELSITPGTVKVHLMHVFEKTGVKDRYELALRSRKPGNSGVPPADGSSMEVLNG